MAGETGRPRDPSVDRRILEAARELLGEGGLEELTISAIAARARVGRPTVYRRYASPRDIALDVLYVDLERLVKEALTVHPAHAEVIDQLMDLSDPFLRYYAEDPRRSAALLQIALFAGGEWQNRFAGQAMRWIRRIAEDLERATTDGRLKSDVNTFVLVQAWFGLYLTTAISGTTGLLDLDAQRSLLRTVLTQHLRGLTPEATELEG